MTKKLLLITIVFMSLLSVILIAVWGTLPENQNLPKVTSISFENYELNDDEDKIINVYDLVTSDTPYYTLSYLYGPNDALTDFYATSSSNDVTVLLDTINQEILVNFNTLTSIGKNVTIRLIDRQTNQSDEITLIFKIPIVIVD